MSKVIYTRGCNTLLHTTQLADDVAFWKSSVKEEKELCWNNFKNFCREKNINVEKTAIVNHSLGRDFVRIVEDDEQNFNKAGNAVITNENVTLVGYAIFNCLVALASFDGKVRGIMNLSKESLKSGVIDEMVDTFAKYGVVKKRIAAYVGACAGKCYYGDIDLYEEVKNSLKASGVEEIEDIFTPARRCVLCAKNDNGEELFSHCHCMVLAR